MKPVALALIVALLTGPAAGYAAQASGPPPAPPQPSTGSQAAEARTELPVSVERIRRKLAQAPRSRTDGLKLDYYIEVYGKYPKIDLFTDFDPTGGPVQYGSPTHREFLDLVTPQEFKSPPADLLTPALALMKWLAEKGKKKPDPPK